MTPMDAIWLVFVLLVLATPVKNYLKSQEIQLAIHSIIGG